MNDEERYVRGLAEHEGCLNAYVLLSVLKLFSKFTLQTITIRKADRQIVSETLSTGLVGPITLRSCTRQSCTWLASRGRLLILTGCEEGKEQIDCCDPLY